MAEPGIRILEDFSSSAVGRFPAGWKKSRDKPPAPYEVIEESGERYLHALDRGESIKIVKKAEWDPSEFPFLRFRWRVHQLPPRANEKLRNDSAAGVYVVFERRGIQIYPNALKYVWSTGLPVGDSVRTGRGYNQIVVLESGEEKKGLWIEESVNVCSDYRRFFGKSAPDVQAIGILTDANATDSSAEADYDDFALARAGSGESADCTP
ncbi:MAG: DUF3047 domain-containing protein [Nitrospirae bacterium]|nr:DUF3047 domain-containing protein [Nitrospirota bacterium]